MHDLKGIHILETLPNIHIMKLSICLSQGEGGNDEYVIPKDVNVVFYTHHQLILTCAESAHQNIINLLQAQLLPNMKEDAEKCYKIKDNSKQL